MKSNQDSVDKYIIPFGHYEGEYLGDVVMEDRGYVEWLSNIQPPREASRKAAEILKETPKGKR